MTYSKKRNLILGLVLFLTGILFGANLLIKKTNNFPNLPNNPNSPNYLVTSVIDGDTIEIENGDRVRLIGIDAPEQGECYYQESTKALKDLVLNKSVQLDKEISEKDQYDRLLRYVILEKQEADNLFINDYLVRNGYALAESHPPDVRYRGLLSSSQSDAVKEKINIWQECYYAPVEPDRELDTEPLDKNCIIKGNVSESNYGKVYFLPTCGANYDRIKIDPRLGDRYFCAEQDALNAGFRKSTNCP